jgi:HD-GYP domain-containing protein (c-di-GMP phosphodiesterase class II)
MHSLLVYLALGDLVTALEHFELSLGYARVSAVPFRVMVALHNIAGVYGKQGKYREALHLMQETLAWDRGQNDVLAVVASLTNIADAHNHLAAFDEAAQALAEAAALLAAHPDPWRQAHLEQVWGKTLAGAGDLAAAQTQLQAAQQHFAHLSNQRLEGSCWLELGRVYLTQDLAEAAQRALERAQSLLEQVAAHDLLAETHLALTDFWGSQRQFDQALGHHRRYHHLMVAQHQQQQEQRAQAVALRLEVQLAKHETELERLRTQELERLVAERTQALEASQLDVLERLAQVSRFRDAETGEHTRWVGEVSALLGVALGLKEAEVERLRLAARLHDLGKVAIPDHILLKPGKLDAEEMAVVKTHTTIGAEILAQGDSPFLALAETIAKSHHERWDGTGYPLGLVAEAIPLAGRIVAVVDVYDALISPRPYKDPWPQTQVLEYLRQQAGSHFDPQVVEAFLALCALAQLPSKAA